jgi:zinc protease
MTSPTLYVEESRALPLVSIAVAIRAGAAADPPEKDGLTRTMANMLRRGCAGLTSRQIEERIDALGADLVIEAAPGSVTLHADVIRRSVDPMVDLLARLLGEPTFDDVELGKLLRETAGELVDARDNDRWLAVRHFRRVLFKGHPYGRSVRGRLSTIANIAREDVVAHHRALFVQGRVAVAIAGDITLNEAEVLATRLVSRLPQGDRPTDEVASPVAAPGRHLVFVDKPDRTQAQILVGGIGSHPRDEDYIALHTATTVFGGTFTSRLMREIRSKRGWSYGASARLAYERQRDAFCLWTFPASKDAAACIGVELDLLDAWRKKGITSRELAFAKRYLVRSHAFDVDTANKRVHQKLDVELLDLPQDHHFHYVEHVTAVTLQAANQAVSRCIAPADLVISVVGTHREIGEAVTKAIPDLADVQVVAFDAD